MSGAARTFAGERLTSRPVGDKGGPADGSSGPCSPVVPGQRGAGSISIGDDG